MNLQQITNTAQSILKSQIKGVISFKFLDIAVYKEHTFIKFEFKTKLMKGEFSYTDSVDCKNSITAFEIK